MTQARILLIDDDDADRALTAALLRDAVPNAQVVEVTGAVEFAENYRHEGWDVAIGDTQLTWADGVSALRMLKRRNPRCATVVFSHGAPTSIGRLADVDGDGPDVFVKKVRAGYLQLVDIVRQVVSNSNDNDNLLDRARELSTDIQRLLACDTADIADDIVKLRESLQPISTALRLSAD
nr:response regulator [Gammaproteobacteria bacterium]